MYRPMTTVKHPNASTHVIMHHEIPLRSHALFSSRLVISLSRIAPFQFPCPGSTPSPSSAQAGPTSGRHHLAMPSLAVPSRRLGRAHIQASAWRRGWRCSPGGGCWFWQMKRGCLLLLLVLVGHLPPWQLPLLLVCNSPAVRLA